MCEQWVFESIAQGVHNCARALAYLGMLHMGIFIILGIRRFQIEVWRK